MERLRSFLTVQSHSITVRKLLFPKRHYTLSARVYWLMRKFAGRGLPSLKSEVQDLGANLKPQPSIVCLFLIMVAVILEVQPAFSLEIPTWR